MQCRSVCMLALFVGTMLVPSQSAAVLKSLSARSLSAAGVPDPMCKTGVVSLKNMDKPQSCCAGYCGECSDYRTCENVRGQDSKYACCAGAVYGRRCGGGAAANVCLKKCSEAVPPCIMDKDFSYKPMDPGTRNAASNCTHAVADWREMAKNAIKVGPSVPCTKVSTHSKCTESTNNFYLGADGRFKRASNPASTEDGCCWRVDYRGNPAKDAEVCKFNADPTSFLNNAEHVYQGDCEGHSKPTDNECTTNVKYTGDKESKEECMTLQACQDLCTEKVNACTGFNWWPAKGGCRIHTGSYTEVEKSWVTVAGPGPGSDDYGIPYNGECTVPSQDIHGQDIQVKPPCAYCPNAQCV